MARYSSLDPEKFIRIRDAAIELIYKHGYEKTSIQNIANEASIAKGTVYLYFKNKEDLMENVFSYCFEHNINASMEGVESHTNSCDKLKQRVKNIMLWSHNFPKEASIIRPLYIPVNVAGTQNVAFEQSYELNRGYIIEGVKNGEFKNLPPDFLCNIFFSCVEGITTYVLKKPHILNDEELLNKMLDAIIDCIRI